MSDTHEVPLDGEDGDLIYLEQILRHEPTDLLLDDSVPGEVLRAVWRQAIRSALGTFAIFLIIWLLNGGLGFTSRSSKDDAEGIVVTGIFFAVVVFCACWVHFLTRDRQEPVSEWCTLLAGKSAAAGSVYSHIAGKVRERHLPLQEYLAKRTSTSSGVTGNRLILVDGYHYVYISVFSYGTSLYLGWSMWRIRRGSVLFRQYWSTHRDNLDSVGRILNLEQLKAMREAVHAACREALHTAVQDVTVSETYGFPSGMPPIERLPYGSAPHPATAQQR
ncbi:MAG: hypothetical protein ABW224_17375 [Kibdelosporangium sp.]